MLSKTTLIGAQLPSAHPVLRRALTELDSVVVGWGLPELTLTELGRTRPANTAIYFARFLALRGMGSRGELDGLGKQDTERARLFVGMSDGEILKKAEGQFSFHLCLCAGDFRSSGRPYSAGEWQRITDHLREKFSGSMWEHLKHDVGHGFHGHLGYRDFDWRRRFEQQEARAKRLGGEA